MVESIRRGAVAIEPDVALFGLTKLLAVCLGDEGASEGKGFIVSTQFATNQFRTCGDVTPLVAYHPSGVCSSSLGRGGGSRSLGAIGR